MHGVLWVIDQLQAVDGCSISLLIGALEAWQSGHGVSRFQEPSSKIPAVQTSSSYERDGNGYVVTVMSTRLCAIAYRCATRCPKSDLARSAFATQPLWQ